VEFGIFCKSKNAIDIVNFIENWENIFISNKNLGKFVALHGNKKHNSAEFFVHIRWRPEVLNLAYHILRSTKIVRAVER
jgi:quinolinate synthase